MSDLLAVSSELVRISRMSCTKRTLEPCEKFDNFGTIHMSKVAKVHGVLTSLSPMKSSTAMMRYYNGQLNRWKEKSKVCGVDVKVHQTLQKFIERKEAVSLYNCKKWWFTNILIHRNHL